MSRSLVSGSIVINNFRDPRSSVRKVMFDETELTTRGLVKRLKVDNMKNYIDEATDHIDDYQSCA